MWVWCRYLLEITPGMVRRVGQKRIPVGLGLFNAHMKLFRVHVATSAFAKTLIMIVDNRSLYTPAKGITSFCVPANYILRYK